MKTNKIPTTVILLIFSWIIGVSAVLISGYLIIFRFSQANSLILGLSILLGGLLLACLVRMLGVIGQMLFEFRAFVLNNFDKIVSGQANSLRQELRSFKQDLKTQLEQINSDSKDINQNIHQLCAFFEQIEKHLKLKK